MIIRSCVDGNAVVEGARLSRESATIGAATTDGLLATQQTAQEGMILTKELCVELVKVAADLQSEAIKAAFDKVTEKLHQYDAALNVISQTVKQLVKEITDITGAKTVSKE